MGCEAGLKPFEIDGMAPSEVWLMIDGYNERQKGEWERARMISWNIHAHSMMDKQHKEKSPQAFWPLPWDSEVKVSRSPKAIMEHHRKMQEQLKESNGTS